MKVSWLVSWLIHGDEEKPFSLAEIHSTRLVACKNLTGVLFGLDSMRLRLGSWLLTYPVLVEVEI